LFSHRSETQRTARVRLASSLAAAALDSLFEHPAGAYSCYGIDLIIEVLAHHPTRQFLICFLLASMR
jgi:hypothetical protein